MTDEFVTVASTFRDFGSLSLKKLRRPLCQLLWQRHNVIVLTLRDTLQRESYERWNECSGPVRVWRTERRLEH